MLREALSNLTVIDFTQIGAGPTCTMLLADLGARVIKVEPPDGELGRKLGPAWIGEDSALFHGFNRNKLGLALDLKSKDGVLVAQRLIQQSDVVVESMRPGVMARLGLSYETLRASKPDLIYCSISAYGQSGPYADRAGVDGILQADSGLMSIIGKEGEEPAKVAAPVVDVFTGYVAFGGILAQLRDTAITGIGAHLDVNLFSSAVALQQVSLTNYLAEGMVPERIGSAAPYSAPNEAFEAVDGWFMVAAYNGGRWERLIEVLELPELGDDERFSTSSKRVANRREMRAILGARFKVHPREKWLSMLQAADILCAPVANYDDLVKHSQLQSNGLLIDVDHPGVGRVRVPGFPIDSVGAAPVRSRPAPMLGEHSRSILDAFGFESREVETLFQKGVVRSPTHPDIRAAAVG